jgi:flagellar basal-body rod protein FlgB
MDLFAQSLTTLERALDLRMENQRVVAANLANVDTPGYTARKLDFEASMEKALQGAEQPAVVNLSTEPSCSLDGNNVNLEDEMGAMTQNKMMYSVTAQILGAKMRQLTTILDQER